MHEYFSEAAFGSQSDSKIEFRNLWKDPEYQKKHNLSSSTNKEKSSRFNKYSLKTIVIPI
jgi:hypothetical protein